MNTSRSRRFLSRGLIAVAFVATVGCGGQPQPKKTAAAPVPRIAPPPRGVEQAAEPEPEKPPPPPPPQERNPVGPWMEFSIAGGEKIEAKGYLRLHLNPGSESVLELANYDAERHEEFPSIYLRTRTSARSIAELVNKPLPVALTLQVDESGHLLHNLPPQIVELAITEIDGKNVRGRFAGHVHDIDLGGNGAIAGRFQAVIE